MTVSLEYTVPNWYAFSFNRNQKHARSASELSVI